MVQSVKIHATVYIAVNLFLIAIWAVTGGGYFWPIWVILGVSIGVVTQGWKAYGPSNRISEADVQREMEKG